MKNKRVALVTGASRGIGAAITHKLAESGFTLAIHYNSSREQADALCESLQGDGHRVLQANLANQNEVQSLVSATVEQLGQLDVVVNNAGIFAEHKVMERSYPDWCADWQATLATNLLGPANICFCAAQHMRTQGGGRIINISSRGAFRGEPEAPAYGASKAGLNSMSQSLAKALAPENIFIYVIAPGFVNTDMATAALAGTRGDEIRNQSPLGRVAEPEEIAAAVKFFATDAPEYMTGTIVDINGASYLRS